MAQSLEIQYDRLKQVESRLEFTARQDKRHVERLERERAIEHLKRSEMTDFVREIEFGESHIFDDDDNDKAGGNYLAYLKETKIPFVTVDEGPGSLSKKELHERLDFKESQLDRLQYEVRRLRDDLERVTRERNSAQAELERFKVLCICGGVGKEKGEKSQAQNFDDLSALGSLPPLESPPTLKF